MTIYILNLALIIILGSISCINERHGKKIFVILACLQLTLLVGLRSETVGRDTWGYVNLYFPSAMSVPWSSFFYQREGGYYLLTRLISLISTEYPFLLTILAAIPLILICVTVYKYSQDVILSITALITLRIYAFLFTGIRQSIALSICFYSYRFIKEKRPILFTACVLVAATFHYSAIVFLAAYILGKIKLNIRNSILLISMVMLFFMLRNQILTASNIFLSIFGYQYRSDISFKDGMSTLLCYSLIAVFGLIHRKHMIRENAESETLLLFILIASFLYGLGYMIAPFTRIAIYFGWFIVLLLPSVTNIFKDTRERILVKFTVYVLLFAQFLYFGPGFSLIPYSFFWQ